MQTVEFTVKPESLAVIKKTAIEANFAECKAALTEMMRPYQSLVVTPDGISAAKNDRARIRKVAAGIDSMRKAVKTEYQKPLTEFEDRCKELIAICDSGAANLDNQIKEYQRNESEAKIAQIRAVYDEYADTEEYGYLPWNNIYSERWKNKGVSVESAIQTVRDAMQTTKEDLATIRSTVDAEDVPYILDYYRGNQSIRECLRKANEVKARRESEVQRRAAQELARQKEEQRRTAAIEQERAKPTQTATGYSHAVMTNPNDDEMLSITFRATGTRAQFNQLKVFMQSIGMGLYRA